MEGKKLSFSVLCNPDGSVEQILSDPEHLLSETLVGNMFFSIFQSSDLNHILNFFLELSKTGSAILHEARLLTDGKEESISLFGGMFGDRAGIAASQAESGARQLFADISRINNEQVNLIRSISKENARLRALSADHGMFYYDEISQLNNELVNIQRELAKKNKQLDELNNLKNLFLGIAAHDLRSPLGVILSYSELMMDAPASLCEEERNDLIRRVYKTGKFMLGLVNNLLDIANIESGKLELELSNEDIAGVITSSIEMTSLFARSKSIDLLFNPAEAHVMVMIDKPKIDQVITNLITNAIKYSFPESQVLISVLEKEDHIKITIKDQGQGIRENELNKLFKPFQKTSTRSTGGEKSTGLGLSIVKKIVEAHLGEIGVNSIFGKGSEFYFTLPLKINNINKDGR